MNIEISVPGTLISCRSVGGTLLLVIGGASDSDGLDGRETRGGGGGGGGGGVDFFFLPRFFGAGMLSSLAELFLFLVPFSYKN